MNLLNDFPENTYQDWLNQIQKDLKNNTLETLISQTYEGIDIPPAISEEHLDKDFVAHMQAICLSESQKPKNRPHIVFKNLQETRIRVQNALKKGADEVCIELGAGVFALQELTEGIDTSKVFLYFSDFQSIKKNKIPLGIRFGGDFLSEGLLSGKIDRSLFDTLPELIENEYFTLQINLQHYHNSGGNAVQELGFGISQLVEYLHQASERGISLSKLVAKTEISIAVGSAYFMEIAKLRAFKVLINQVFTSFEIQKSAKLHTRTSIWNKTQKDAYNNMLRATTEAMASILGGSHSISIDAYNATNDQNENQTDDQNEFADRIARNTITLLREESNFDKVAEIASGSYMIEYLTKQLTDKAWALFQEGEKQGGFSEIFENEFIKKNIETTRHQKIDDFKNKKIVLVGINKYNNPKDTESPTNPLQEYKYLNINSLERYL